MSHEQNFLDRAPQQRNLPNTRAVRILGIASIPAAIFYALPGIILGFAGLVLANKDLDLYEISPRYFSVESFRKARAARRFSIIGMVFGAAILAALVLYFIFYGEFTMERMDVS